MDIDSNVSGLDKDLPTVFHPAIRPPGIKSQISMIPGMMVFHRLVKNFRYWTRSRSGTVGGIKRAQMSVEEAVSYTQSIFQKIDPLIRNNGGWKDKKILEIGPGDSLGTGLWCLGAGAESYTAIDRFAVDLNQEFEADVLTSIKSKLGSNGKNLCSDALQIGSGDSPYSGRIQYRNDLPIESAPNILGRSGFDIIFSNAVLEHVENLEATLSAMNDLLADGGLMFHDVDLRSHQTFENHPLQFLEYPRPLWHLMSSNNGEPNRARMPRYLNILEALSFENIETTITQIFEIDMVKSRHRSLASEFRNLPVNDLLPAVFCFTCRKPEGSPRID